MFFKLLKIADNLRAELNGQINTCVTHESRHMCKQVSRLSAKRGMTFACLKFAFSKNCYSAPLWPIGVRLVSVIFGMALYTSAKFQRMVSLHVCVRGRWIIKKKLQFSLAYKSLTFSLMENPPSYVCRHWSKVHVYTVSYRLLINPRRSDFFTAFYCFS